MTVESLCIVILLIRISVHLSDRGLLLFWQGTSRKNTPITVQTANDKISEPGRTTIGHDMAEPIIFDAPIPSRIPITPPVMLSRIDSVRNCNNISKPFPPIAIRKTYFPGSFSNRYIHYIHDPDSSHQKRDSGYCPQ